MNKPVQLYLNAQEAKAIQMGLGRIIEDLKTMSSALNMPWTPDARKTLKTILNAATSAGKKIQRITGIAANIPPYNPGDENEFLTKES
jgi:hypothetical protein